jgi:SIR2-like domain/CHC2 zinc finger
MNSNSLQFRRRFDAALPGIRWRGDKGTGRCPFHNDHRPSLSIDGQKGLYFCHGCHAKGNVQQFERRVKALGSSPTNKSVSEMKGEDQQASELKREIVGQYTYLDEEGDPLFQQVRFHPKSFAFRSLSKEGKWVAFEPICVCEEAIREFVNKLFDFEYKRRIVHVHGRFDKPNSIVLTEKEYAALYNGSQVAKRFWDNVPLYRSCIFFGFSFTDEDITEGFNLGNFNRAHRDGSQTPHFALLALADKDRDKERVLRASHKAKYGIDLVFFDSIDSNYTGYSKVIEKIAHDIPPPAARGLVGQPESPTVANDVAHLKALTVLNIRKGATGELR